MSNAYQLAEADPPGIRVWSLILTFQKNNFISSKFNALEYRTNAAMEISVHFSCVEQML